MIDHFEAYLDGKLSTTDGKVPKVFDAPAPDPAVTTDGMHASYWVLSESERAKGFVRPVRNAYMHIKCGCVTTMNRALAETYAVNPHFYGSTFCYSCRSHFPVGAAGEFVWAGSTDKVGT